MLSNISSAMQSKVALASAISSEVPTISVLLIPSPVEPATRAARLRAQSESWGEALRSVKGMHLRVLLSAPVSLKKIAATCQSTCPHYMLTYACQPRHIVQSLILRVLIG